MSNSNQTTVGVASQQRQITGVGLEPDEGVCALKSRGPHIQSLSYAIRTYDYAVISKRRWGVGTLGSTDIIYAAEAYNLAFEHLLLHSQVIVIIG